MTSNSPLSCYVLLVSQVLLAGGPTELHLSRILQACSGRLSPSLRLVVRGSTGASAGVLSHCSQHSAKQNKYQRGSLHHWDIIFAFPSDLLGLDMHRSKNDA